MVGALNWLRLKRRYFLKLAKINKRKHLNKILLPLCQLLTKRISRTGKVAMADKVWKNAEPEVKSAVMAIVAGVWVKNKKRVSMPPVLPPVSILTRWKP
jgi:hypothetical protein